MVFVGLAGSCPGRRVFQFIENGRSFRFGNNLFGLPSAVGIQIQFRIQKDHSGGFVPQFFLKGEGFAQLCLCRFALLVDFFQAGRQASSMGGTYADIIDIMVEYGAVNACNLDGGSSTVMLYRDYQTGEVSMINSYSLLQEKPRRMPTFIMVRSESEG